MPPFGNLSRNQVEGPTGGIVYHLCLSPQEQYFVLYRQLSRSIYCSRTVECTFRGLCSKQGELKQSYRWCKMVSMEPPGRLGRSNMLLGDDPRCDPRLLSFLAESRHDQRPLNPHLSASTPLDERIASLRYRFSFSATLLANYPFLRHTLETMPRCNSTTMQFIRNQTISSLRALCNIGS